MDGLFVGTNPSGEFFVSGGTVPQDALSYVSRQADEELLQALARGEFCYVLTSRQMGKSSLMVRTAHRLRAQSQRAAVIDLTAIGQNLSPDQWYAGMLTSVGRQLDCAREMKECWRELPDLSPVQRFVEVLRQTALAPTDLPLVIFVDEIDGVRSLPFTADEYFAAIRECHNRRSREPEFNRLTFCLLGVATPSDLIRDTRNTPFNIGRRIELSDFTEAEASRLAVGLRIGAPGVGARSEAEAALLLRRILYWTGGQPYLTQRLCREVSAIAEAGIREVDQCCESLFLSRKAREQDDNLIFVGQGLAHPNTPEVRGEEGATALLHLYERVRRGRYVRDEKQDARVELLHLSGIVRSEKGRLRVRNRIYERVFDPAWVADHLPHAELRRQREAYRRVLFRTIAVSSTVLTTMAGLLGYALYSAGEARRLGNDKERLAQQRQEALEQTQALLYTSQIQATWQAVHSGDYDRARTLLDTMAKPPLQDYVGEWEWNYLWGLCHRDLATFRHHSSPISRLQFINDGREIASADLHHQVVVTEVATGKPLRRISFPAGSKDEISLSQDGHRLLRVRDNELLPRTRTGVVELVDVATQRVSLTRPFPSNAIHVRLSPNGRFWAALVGDKGRRKLQVWSDGGPVVPFPSGSPVTAFAFTPDSRRIVVATADGRLGEWGLRSGTYRALGSPGVRITGLTLSDRGRFAAVVAADARLRIWDLQAQRLYREWPMLSGKLNSLRFSPDETRMALATRVPRAWREPGELAVYNLADPRRPLRLEGHTGMVTAIAFSPDGGTLATGGYDSQIRLWNLREAVRPKPLVTGRPTYRLHFSANGTRLVTVNPDHIRLWDLSARRCLARIPPPSPNFVYDLSADLSSLAVASDTIVTLYHSLEGSRTLRLTHPAEVVAAAFHPDGRGLLTVAVDGFVRVWSVADGKELTSYPLTGGRPVAARLTPRHGHLVVLDADRLLTYRDSADGTIKHQIRLPGLGSPALGISPDEAAIAVGSNRGVWLWDISKTTVQLLPGLRTLARSVSFSRDARTLACGSSDAQIHLWNVATRQPIGTLPGSLAGNLGVAFSPDGLTLAVGGEDICVRFWGSALRRPGLSQLR